MRFKAKHKTYKERINRGPAEVHIKCQTSTFYTVLQQRFLLHLGETLYFVHSCTNVCSWSCVWFCRLSRAKYSVLLCWQGKGSVSVATGSLAVYKTRLLQLRSWEDSCLEPHCLKNITLCASRKVTLTANVSSSAPTSPVEIFL